VCAGVSAQCVCFVRGSLWFFLDNGIVQFWGRFVTFWNSLETDIVRNLLMVPSGTRRLKATAQEVSVNKDGEEKSGVERSDEEEGCNVENVEEVNDGQHEV
jgi:hypothetical protein